MAVEGEIQDNLSITLFRVFIGFFLGTITGILIGMTMGASKKVRLLLDPIVAATYPIPKLAIFPLLMVIFGIGSFQKSWLLPLGVSSLPLSTLWLA